MLILSLIVSAVLLLIANAIVWMSPKSAPLIIPFAAVAVVGFGVLGVGLTAVFFQGIALSFLAGAWCYWPGSRSKYALASTGATVLVYAIILFAFVRPEQQKYAQLREKYRFEDMVARVPLNQAKVIALSDHATQQIQHLETNLRDQSGNHREWMLRNLHENTSKLFVNSPGFGMARIIRPNDHWLQPNPPEPEPIAQPGVRDTSAGTEEPASEVAEQTPLFELHNRSFLDFVNPQGYGYFKNRKQVAGFISHRVSISPEPPAIWSLKTLDLVGLLLHEQPVAYVSEHLPRMDELKTAPTRALDSFESAALAELRKGESLYVRQNDNTLRMVGALRAVQQCTACHGCERGELLGAFSYVMQAK